MINGEIALQNFGQQQRIPSDANSYIPNVRRLYNGEFYDDGSINDQY